MAHTTTLRTLIQAPTLLVMPGIFDGFSARLVEQTGFAALMGIADPDSVAIAVDASSAEQVSLQHVSANFFQALGVLPVAGRPFRYCGPRDRTTRCALRWQH